MDPLDTQAIINIDWTRTNKNEATLSDDKSKVTAKGEVGVGYSIFFEDMPTDKTYFVEAQASSADEAKEEIAL